MMYAIGAANSVKIHRHNYTPNKSLLTGCKVGVIEVVQRAFEKFKLYFTICQSSHLQITRYLFICNPKLAHTLEKSLAKRQKRYAIVELEYLTVI